MTEIFDKSELAIPCPGCGEKNPKSIAWIKANDKMICQGCGETVTLQREKLIEGLKSVEKTLAGLKGRFKKR